MGFLCYNLHAVEHSLFFCEVYMAKNQSNVQQQTPVKKGVKTIKNEISQAQRQTPQRGKIGGLVLETKLGMFGF